MLQSENAGVTLLWVTSDPALGEAVTQALGERGFLVQLAASSDEALSLLSATPPHAVVVDLPSDSESALKDLARLRETVPAVPLVLLAEEGETRVAMRGMELGASDVVHKPTDWNLLADRLRRFAEPGTAAPSEKTIAELMVSPATYDRVYEDDPVRKVIQTLTEALFGTGSTQRNAKAHRSVLVYGRDETFLGLIRLNDVLAWLVSGIYPGAPPEPGVFLARCRLLGSGTAGDLIGEQTFVEADAPLVEAVQLMVDNNLINIPVLRQGQLVGVLTDRDLLLETCSLVSCVW